MTEGTLLLVVEGRAACPDWLDHLGPAPEDGFCVLEQEEWEPSAPFLSRLDGTLDRCFALDRGTTVVVLGITKNETTLAARRLLLLDVTTHAARNGRGHVVLTHGVQHDAAFREELQSLAADLADEWEDAGVEVRAVVDDAPARSGVQVRKASERPLAYVTGHAAAE